MRDWVRQLTQWISQLRAALELLKARLNRIFHIREPLQIVPYRGYGTPIRLICMGRVSQGKKVRSHPKDASLWQNLLNTYRRFESDAVPCARLRVTVADQQMEIVANKEGYFQTEIVPSHPLQSDRLWYQTPHFELLQPPSTEGQPAATTVGTMIVPTAATQFVVISDIDDTIVYAAATDFSE